MPPQVSSFLERVGGLRRVAIAAVGLVAAATILVVSRWATAPEWVPAFSSVPMESVGKLTDELTKAGIAYKLERGGSDVLVASTDVARARVLLAKGNLLPTPGGGSRAGMELFDQNDWGQTDLVQKVKYRRALEGELGKTIAQIRGIEQARVELALNEQATFRRQAETPARASVFLSLRSGYAPAAEVVQGIQHLVASSVAGIEADNVVVLADHGRLLSVPADGSTAGLSSRQLGVRKEVEGYLQEKAQKLLEQMVGPGNATVEVSADINFDKVARTSQTVDPDRQALSTEQKAEIVPGAEGGAGSTNSAIAYENSRTTETFEGAIGGIRRLSVSVLVNHRLPAAPAAADSAKGAFTTVTRSPRALSAPTAVRTRASMLASSSAVRATGATGIVSFFAAFVVSAVAAAAGAAGSLWFTSTLTESRRMPPIAPSNVSVVREFS